MEKKKPNILLGYLGYKRSQLYEKSHKMCLFFKKITIKVDS